jgi:hypothetical protein
MANNGSEKEKTLTELLTARYGEQLVRQVNDVQLVEEPESRTPLTMAVTNKNTVVIRIDIVKEIPVKKIKKAAYWLGGIGAVALGGLMRFRPEVFQKMLESLSGGSS